MAKKNLESNRGASYTATGTTPLTNSTTETILFTQTIAAGDMGLSKILSFKMVCILSTPLLSIPLLTLKIKYGSNTMTLASSIGLAVSLTSKPFIIEFEMQNQDVTTTQFAYGFIQQPSATLPMLLSTNDSMQAGNWTTDSASDQIFSVTAQFSALSSSTSLTPMMVKLEMV